MGFGLELGGDLEGLDLGFGEAVSGGCLKMAKGLVAIGLVALSDPGFECVDGFGCGCGQCR